MSLQEHTSDLKRKAKLLRDHITILGEKISNNTANDTEINEYEQGIKAINDSIEILRVVKDLKATIKNMNKGGKKKTRRVKKPRRKTRKGKKSRRKK
jgi:23S rRNA A2030 N6-methylase RlmJ